MSSDEKTAVRHDASTTPEKSTPPHSGDVWVWRTTQPKLLKGLFDAITHVTSDCRLIVGRDRLSMIDQVDKSGLVRVSFVLHQKALKEDGEYSMNEDRFMIPLDVRSLFEALKGVRVHDTVVLSVPTEIFRKRQPKVELYVHKPLPQESSYAFVMDWLHLEFLDFGRPNPPALVSGKDCRSVNVSFRELKPFLSHVTKTDKVYLQLSSYDVCIVASVSNDHTRKLQLKLSGQPFALACGGCETAQLNQAAHFDGCLV